MDKLRQTYRVGTDGEWLSVHGSRAAAITVARLYARGRKGYASVWTNNDGEQVLVAAFYGDTRLAVL